MGSNILVVMLPLVVVFVSMSVVGGILLSFLVPRYVSEASIASSTRSESIGPTAPDGDSNPYRAPEASNDGSQKFTLSRAFIVSTVLTIVLLGLMFVLWRTMVAGRARINYPVFGYVSLGASALVLVLGLKFMLRVKLKNAVTIAAIYGVAMFLTAILMMVPLAVFASS